MKPIAVVQALALLLALAGGWAVVRAATSPLGEPALEGTPRSSPAPTAILSHADHDSLAEAVVAANPFDAERRPPEPGAVPAPDVDAPPIDPGPVLRLVGIVTGERASALIEGWPGIQGVRAVREGDSLAGYTVQSITAEAVRVAGRDSVLVLRIKEPTE